MVIIISSDLLESWQVHVRDMVYFQTCQRHVRDIFVTCQVHVIDMFGTCYRYVRDMMDCQSHLGDILGIFLGHVRDILVTFLGHGRDRSEICQRHVGYKIDAVKRLGQVRLGQVNDRDMLELCQRHFKDALETYLGHIRGKVQN